MRNLNEWFSEYAVSHQNETNQAIHYICVPAIFFSIIGFLMSIPAEFLKDLIPGNTPFLENWAAFILIPVLVFYFRLSTEMGLKMTLFTGICLIGNYFISLISPLWLISLIIFAIAWMGQFYGHKIEGKKPSFLKDIQFLLIGPAWVIHKIFSNKGRKKIDCR